MTTFQDLFDTVAFNAHEKQMRLAATIGDRDWQLKSAEARLTFGEELSYPVQFLGTASEVSNTLASCV